MTPEMRTCPACGQLYDGKKDLCPHCHAQLCIVCGAALPTPGDICINCEEDLKALEAWDRVAEEQGWVIDDEPGPDSPKPDDMVEND